MNTTSAIISFDGWYQRIRQMTFGIPMNIKNLSMDQAEYLETGKIVTSEPRQVISEYSFIDDDIIDMDRLIDPMEIIPQDGLRYSIINILAYIVGKMVNDYMTKYCINSHSYDGKVCRLSMKNEFLSKIGACNSNIT